MRDARTCYRTPQKLRFRGEPRTSHSDNSGGSDSRLTPYHSIGAGYEARTRYLHLGKVALYQMS